MKDTGTFSAKSVWISLMDRCCHFHEHPFRVISKASFVSVPLSPCCGKETRPPLYLHAAASCSPMSQKSENQFQSSLQRAFAPYKEAGVWWWPGVREAHPWVF